MENVNSDTVGLVPQQTGEKQSKTKQPHLSLNNLAKIAIF